MARDLTQKQFVAAAARQGLTFTTMNGLGAWLRDEKRGGNVLYGCWFDSKGKLLCRHSLMKALAERTKDAKVKK